MNPQNPNMTPPPPPPPPPSNSGNQAFGYDRIEPAGRGNRFDRPSKQSAALMLGFYLTGVVIAVFGAIAVQQTASMGGVILLGVGSLLVLLGAIFMLVGIYAGWQIIQGPAVTTTPGTAVGLLFVPLFNFYWFFVAIWQWAVAYNSLIDRENLDPRRKVPVGAYLAFAITVPLGIIPIVNIVTSLAQLVLTIVLTISATNATNYLIENRRDS